MKIYLQNKYSNRYPKTYHIVIVGMTAMIVKQSHVVYACTFILLFLVSAIGHVHAQQFNAHSDFWAVNKTKILAYYGSGDRVEMNCPNMEDVVACACSTSYSLFLPTHADAGIAPFQPTIQITTGEHNIRLMELLEQAMVEPFKTNVCTCSWIGANGAIGLQEVRTHALCRPTAVVH